MMPLFEARMWFRNHPWVLKTVWKHRSKISAMQRHSGSRRVVEPGDAAVIEGYARSANTFAHDSFVASQPKPVQVGHHFHSPAQFFLARDYGIPAMLLLREPVAAALSYVVFNEGAWSAERALRFYVAFHRPLLKITDHFVVAPFEEVTTDFSASIRRMNARFGSDFALFDHDANSEQHIFDGIAERISRKEQQQGRSMKMRRHFPDAEKAQRRKEIATVFDEPALDALKAKARAQYDALMARL